MTQRGRRSKFTPEAQEKVISAIRAGNYANVAAEYAGICERTLYRWLEKGRTAKKGPYRTFWESMQRAESEAEVRAVAMVQKHMDDNWQAAMTFLARRYPDRWGRKDRLSLDVDPKETLCNLLAISPDELEEFVDEAARL